MSHFFSAEAAKPEISEKGKGGGEGGGGRGEAGGRGEGGKGELLWDEPRRSPSEDRFYRGE